MFSSSGASATAYRQRNKFGQTRSASVPLSKITRRTIGKELGALDESETGHAPSRPRSMLKRALTRAVTGQLKPLDIYPQNDGALQSSSKIGLVASFLEEEESETMSAGMKNNEGKPCLKMLERVVQSYMFESVMAAIICINCLTIGIQVHLCPPDESSRGSEECPEDIVMVMEHVCVAIFVFEFFLRGTCLGFSQYVRTPIMFADAMLVWLIGVGCSWILPLVVPSVKELRIVSALRACRLLRLLRVVRFHFKDMWRLFSGMARSAKTLCSMICVVVFINYVFGILGVVLIGDSPQLEGVRSAEFFAGLDKAMFTLVQVITGDAWASIIARPIIEHSADTQNLWMFFIAYISIGTLVLMNLMTAIIVENALEMSKEDEEEQLHELTKRKRKEFMKLARVFSSLDSDESGSLDWEEFLEVEQNRPDILDKFKLLGFDEKEFKNLFSDLDNGEGSLTIDEFLEGVMKMQGEAKSKDLIRTQKSVERLHAKMDLLVNLIDQGGHKRRELVKSHLGLSGFLKHDGSEVQGSVTSLASLGKVAMKLKKKGPIRISNRKSDSKSLASVYGTTKNLSRGDSEVSLLGEIDKPKSNSPNLHEGLASIQAPVAKTPSRSVGFSVDTKAVNDKSKPAKVDDGLPLRCNTEESVKISGAIPETDGKFADNPNVAVLVEQAMFKICQQLEQTKCSVVELCRLDLGQKMQINHAQAGTELKEKQTFHSSGLANMHSTDEEDHKSMAGAEASNRRCMAGAEASNRRSSVL